MSPSSASTTQSLAEAFESKEVLGYLVVDFESAKEKTSIRRSPHDGVTTGNSSSVIAAIGVTGAYKRRCC